MNQEIITMQQKQTAIIKIIKVEQEWLFVAKLVMIKKFSVECFGIFFAFRFSVLYFHFSIIFWKQKKSKEIGLGFFYRKTKTILGSLYLYIHSVFCYFCWLNKESKKQWKVDYYLRVIISEIIFVFLLQNKKETRHNKKEKLLTFNKIPKKNKETEIFFCFFVFLIETIRKQLRKRKVVV